MIRLKRFTALLLLLALTAFPAFADSGTVTANQINIRSGPGTTYAIVATANQGETLTLLSEPENGWYKVSYSGVTGYASASYIEKSAAAVGGVITATLVNFRAGPGEEHAKVGQLSNGTRVEILGYSGQWCKVTANYQTGWVLAEFVKADAAATTAAATSSATSTTTAASSAEGDGYVTVTGTSVNLRSGPGTTYSIVGYAVKGDKLILLGKSGSWVHIKKGTLEAYASADYVQIQSGTATSATTTATTSAATSAPTSAATSASTAVTAVAGWTGTVTANAANLRSGPATTYSIVGYAVKGDKLGIVSVSGDWYRITKGSLTAYISASIFSAGEMPYDEKDGVINVSAAYLRSGAGTSYSDYGTLAKNTKLKVVGESGEWYKVTVSGKTGYVYKTYVTITAAETTTAAATTTSATTTASSQTTSATEATTTVPEFKVLTMSDSGVVLGSFVNVRVYPFSTADVMGVKSQGTFVTITGYVESGWYQIEYGSAKAYISETYVRAGVGSYTRPTTGQPVPESDSSGLAGALGSAVSSEYQSNPSVSDVTGEDIVAYAKTFLGVKYVYGGSLPETGFDCSGFTKYVYNHFGIDLPRMQQYNAGRRVDKSELVPGDLVFFNTTGYSISHIGIYIGYGQFIHAPTTGSYVKITDLESDYYAARYVCAVRLIG